MTRKKDKIDMQKMIEMTVARKEAVALKKAA